MENIKISIIGAGSGAFSLSLIRDICLTPNLKGSTISLMDINQERLDAAHNVCTRYAKEMGIDLNIEKTLDRCESLEGADFVIDTALTAPHARLIEGFKIAQKHGYRYAGSYNVMYDEAFWIDFYQLKFFESVTEDISRICPNAWHLLVANPVLAGITYITRKYPNAKVVGLCHGYNAVYKIAEMLGLEKEHMKFEISGVNHFVWLTHFTYKGEDALKLLDEWIDLKAEDYYKIDPGPYNPLCRKLIDVYKKFGVLPIGDTASWTGASWPWWYQSDDAVEKSWAQEPETGWNGYFDGVKSIAADIKRYSEDLDIKLTDVIKPIHSGEPMIPLIESIAFDIERIMITNIQNTNEFVKGIPTDFEVEIPTLVSKKGIQGLKALDLPKNVIAHTLRDRVAPTELELLAYEKGSREFLLQLILTDKWTMSVKQANEFLDEILALPYHEEMKKHYK